MNRTHREWYIEFLGNPWNDTENYKRYVSGTEFKPVGFDAEVIHVIEKSAYDNLVNLRTQDIENLQITQYELQKAMDQIKELKAELVALYKAVQ